MTTENQADGARAAQHNSVRLAVSHQCRFYMNARLEVIDPAEQGGIGCKICLPPDGRYHKEAQS